MTSKIITYCLTLLGLMGFNFSYMVAPSHGQGRSNSRPPIAEPSNSGQINGPLLSAAQIQELKSLNVRIVVPQTLPQGYVVKQMITEPCPNDSPCRFGPRYSIIYRNEAKDACFTIEGVGGGVGGPPSLENSVRVVAGVLGATDLHYGRYSIPELRFTNPKDLLYMDFTQPNLGKSLFYRVVGSVFTRQTYFANNTSNTSDDGNESIKICQNEVSLGEIVPMIQSLMWLQ
ncbi:MAG: hypothetical protein WCO45_16070 [Pseudanabaena sp. ELA607]